jgi:hypothetical protein
MIITAKFASVCPCCSVRIVPGAKVEWSKGSPAKHVACVSVTVTVARPAARRGELRGRWTGCSCGSREDSYGDLIPSDRNCGSCEHDA